MINALIETLDKTSDLSNITKILDQFSISRDDLKDWISFDLHQYSRLPIHKTSNYEVWCFCWLPGQCSPIHDHPQSTASIRIISGEATEYIYEQYNGKARQIGSRTLYTGSTYEEKAVIHCLGNAGTAFENLVTLHVYAPPPLIIPESNYVGGRVYEEQL